MTILRSMNYYRIMVIQFILDYQGKKEATATAEKYQNTELNTGLLKEPTRG